MKKRKSLQQGRVYLDLEAAKSPEEVGGWNNISKMGLAMAVTFRPDTQEIRIFECSQVEELVRLLNHLWRTDGRDSAAEPGPVRMNWSLEHGRYDPERHDSASGSDFAKMNDSNSSS
jgi:hypothetical protein